MSQSPIDPETQRAEQQGQRGMGAALEEGFAEHREVKSELMQLIGENEQLSGLSPSSRELLQNLLSKHFPLGNYSSEQVHELKWRFWGVYEMFLAMHPHPDSVIQGHVRAFVHDDPNARLVPLGQQERLAVFQVFTKAWAKLTPGEDMKQQEIFATVRSESYVQRGDTDDSGGILGRFGG